MSQEVKDNLLETVLQQVADLQKQMAETKDSLLKTMMQQIADLQKQVTEAMRASKASPYDGRGLFGMAEAPDKADNKNGGADAALSYLTFMGPCLGQMKETFSSAVKVQSNASRMGHDDASMASHIEAFLEKEPSSLAKTQKAIALLQLDIIQMKAKQAYGAVHDIEEADPATDSEDGTPNSAESTAEAATVQNGDENISRREDRSDVYAYEKEKPHLDIGA